MFPLAGNGTVDAVVTDQLVYGGPDGRPSAKSTRFNLGPTSYLFSSAYQRHDLGNVSQVTYRAASTARVSATIRCASRDSATPAASSHRSPVWPRTSTTNRAAGHACQRVVETVSIDPADGLCGPAVIAATNAGWSTSAYNYDGAGNIKKIGAQDYRYDRLVFGETDQGTSQSLSYDSYGNIQSIGTGALFLSTPTSATTNRLTLTSFGSQHVIAVRRSSWMSSRWTRQVGRIEACRFHSRTSLTKLERDQRGECSPSSAIRSGRSKRTPDTKLHPPIQKGLEREDHHERQKRPS